MIIDFNDIIHGERGKLLQILGGVTSRLEIRLEFGL